MNTVHRKVSAFAAALLLLSTANPAAQLPASAFLRGDVFPERERLTLKEGTEGLDGALEAAGWMREALEELA